MAEAFDRSSWDGFLYAIRDGKATTTYDYTIAGQLASLTTRNALTTGNSEPRTDFKESFLWDGLALIRRGGVNYLNEPHAGGGAALLAGDNVMFNDMLGTTLGVEGEGDTFSTSRYSTYGDTDYQSQTTDHLFTGKPYVEGLGHAFLLRNYRADLGKWQTADPLGHPDGWNNFAYCNGQVTSMIDLYGALSLAPITTQAGMIQRILLSEVLNPARTTNYDLDDASIGMQAIVNCIYNRINNYGKDVTHSGVKEYFGMPRGLGSVSVFDVLTAAGQFGTCYSENGIFKMTDAATQIINNLMQNVAYYEQGQTQFSDSYMFVQAVIYEAASGSDSPFGDKVFAFRTERSGSPGGRFVYIGTAGGNDYYTLRVIE